LVSRRRVMECDKISLAVQLGRYLPGIVRPDY
jgi:hypothetical protein